LLYNIESNRFLTQKEKIPKTSGVPSVLFDYPDGDFKQAFRMSKVAFNKLHDEIKGHHEFHNNSKKNKRIFNFS
jgi:hypothetical protein